VCVPVCVVVLLMSVMVFNRGAVRLTIYSHHKLWFGAFVI
jgi:hypothetical protein